MTILGLFKGGASAAVFVLAIFVASPASAADSPYELDPILSLTAECQVSAADPVKDPGCEYLPPPDGPVERFREPRAVAIDPYGNEYVSSTATGKSRIDIFDDEGFFITEFFVPAAKSIAVDSAGNLYAFESSDGDIVRYAPEPPYEPEAGEIEYVDPSVTVTTGSFVGALAVDASNDHLFLARPFEITELKSADEGNELVGSFKPEKLGAWTNALAVDAQRRRLYLSSCPGIAITECEVLVVDADSHALLEQIDGSTTPAGEFFSEQAWLAVAVDEELGDFFIADIEDAKAVYQFDEEYNYLSQLKSSNFLSNNSTQIAVSNGERSLLAESCDYPDPSPPPGDSCNRHVLFVPAFPPENRVFAFHPPNQVPPVIEGVATTSIGKTEAELTATIFPGGLPTEYRFEITTLASWEANEFSDATVIPGGTIPAESLATKVTVFATGLTPEQSYRFRAVAKNDLGSAEEAGQNEATFATYDDALIDNGCSNQPLRLLGRSARLPDCRAYELVTPSDTIGRPPRSVGFVGNVFSTIEASPVGDAVSFKIEGGSLPDSSGIGSFEGDPYLATRSGAGWSTELAGAGGDEATVSIPGSTSPDQRYAFWTARIEGPLVVNGEATEYLRYPDGHSELIGRGSLGTDPKAIGRLITENGAHVIFQTFNAVPTQAVQLEPNAPPNGTNAIYDRTPDEVTHVVSLLPGDITPAAGQNAVYVGASKDGEGIAFSIGNKLYLRVDNETTYEVGEEVEFAGVSEGGARVFYVEGGDLKALDTTSGGPEGEVVEFSGTGDVTPVNVSTDGSRAYFASPSVLPSPGAPAENPQGDTPIPPAGGQGVLGAKGTGTLSTAKGTGTLTSGSSEVTGVSTSEGVFEKGMQISGTGIPAGTRIESVGSGILTLSQAATQSGSTSLTAGSVTVTGVSTTEGEFRVGMTITATGIPPGTIITEIDEGAQILTLSREASASGAQPLSAFAWNLYGSEEGSISFVATVTNRDVEGTSGGSGVVDGLGLWVQALESLQPSRAPSRTNPDGSVLLFQSRAELTGYPESEFPQIYRYDSDAGRLHCISCIPAGTSATSAASLQTLTFDSTDPSPLTPNAFVPNLTPEGNRVFFESDEALVSTDSDGVKDVYEWEDEGIGSCDRPGGCLYLISSGQSARDNFLYAHSQSGDDVFFTTGDQLTGFDDSAAISIYDAKVGGGFPEPVQGGGCSGEGCHGDLTPPPILLPSESGGRSQSGNVPPKGRSCPKGKRKVKKNGKVRCVKKKHKGKGKKRAGASRRVGK